MNHDPLGPGSGSLPVATAVIDEEAHWFAVKDVNVLNSVRSPNLAVLSTLSVMAGGTPACLDR